MPFTPNPLPAGLDGPACTVEMTPAQAALIRRAMLVLLDVGDAETPLTEDEREEAQAIADMAVEIDPSCINGWCL